MDAKNTQQRRLRTEIKWMREALDIVEFEREHHVVNGIIEARKECIPLRFKKYTDSSPELLRKGIARRRSDLQDLERGDWE